MTTRRCSNPQCHVHDGETCPLGALAPESCKTWLSSGGEVSSEDTAAIAYEARVPWSGSALGLSDLMLLLPRSRHMLVALLGSHDAGKTTLLTGNYLLLLKGGQLANASFAGSRTLGAWESLASWMRFHDSALPPQFPPHTPRGNSRVPGLLHVALRRLDGEFRDILLADSPGEWFAKWAINENDPLAEGAQWLAKHADAFLVVADCDRLQGKDRGAARSDMLQLLERLGNHVGTRPAILVWTKSEYKVPVGIRESIQQALAENLPGAMQQDISVSHPETLATALSEIVALAWNGHQAEPIVEPIRSTDSFLAFRGHNANS